MFADSVFKKLGCGGRAKTLKKEMNIDSDEIFNKSFTLIIIMRQNRF